LESAEIVDKVSKEIVSLDQVAHSKVSVNVENDSYEPAAVLTENVNYGTPIIMPVTTYDEVLGPDKANLLTILIILKLAGKVKNFKQVMG
jgi:hypothetical protein